MNIPVERPGVGQKHVQKWEYMSFLANGPDLERRMPVLGNEGWEAVGFVATEWTPPSSIDRPQQVRDYRVLLKRPKA